tara:strand:- start:111 stop:284 length:174 start_codon:yes stop_codon:yes gene_type:complete
MSCKISASHVELQFVISDPVIHVQNAYGSSGLMSLIPEHPDKQLGQSTSLQNPSSFT